MDNRLEAMTVLLAAVDTGSLSAASRHLRIPLATVSRRVSELEERLNVRLLLRGGRKLVLTDAGRDYVVSCRRIVEEIAEIERTAAGEYRAPQGELIAAAPVVMGRTHALPTMVEFLRAYPDISMRVMLTDRNVSLLEEHIDIALRVGSLPDSSLIATRVGQIRQVLCASPAYLKSRSTPRKPADLASHDCVTYEGVWGWNKWEFGTKGTSETHEVSSRLVVSSADAAIAAAIAGGGIARVFSYAVDDHVKSRALVRVLAAYELPPTQVNLVYAGQRQLPLKLRAFLDFSIPRLRKRLAYKNAE